MGLFSKIKNIFAKEIEEEKQTEVTTTENQEETQETTSESIKPVKIYEKGLTKSRKGFVSNLISLTSKYNKINEKVL